MNDTSSSPPAAPLIQFEKLLRQGLAAAVGVAAAHGYALDTSSMANLICSCLFMLALVAWSVVRKTTPDSTQSEVLRQMASAVGMQVSTLLAGWLSQKQLMDGAGSAAPESVFMALALYWYSAKHNPDVHVMEAKTDNRLKLPLLLLCCLPLSSCLTAYGDGTHWAYGSVGTDVQGLNISASGMTLTDQNQTKALANITSAAKAAALNAVAVKATSGVLNGVTDKIK